MATRSRFETRDQRLDRVKAANPDLGTLEIRRVMIFEDLEDKLWDVEDISDVRHLLDEIIQHLRDRTI